ncbi:MAG: zinc ABC transporter substrate-binding protein, partial [Clostridium sp.]|nr:zinc ABC transporter substrate-binding protein [Clostridium sp.]
PLIANTVDREDTSRDVYLNIITCNKIQYEMVKDIVGNKHNVEYMFNDEQASKDFKYTDETISNISNMDLFFYNGNIMEPWHDELISSLNKGNLGIINSSRGIRTINLTGENSGKENPYYMVGYDEYKIALYNIKVAIQEKDPKNRELYEENYNKVIKSIDEVLKTYDDKKSVVKEYSYIALDDKLDYFYRNIGISPIKLNGKTIDDVIKENRIDPAKVIVLKDKETVTEDINFNIIELNGYSGANSARKVLLDNYNVFYNYFSVKENNDGHE